jgi:hypothetical protein
MLFSMPDSVLFISIYIFLLIGIVLSYLIVKSIKKHRLTNKRFVVFFLYNSLNFFIIYHLLTVPPTVSSGNGNPFIPYLFFSALIYIVLCIVIDIEFRNILKNCNSVQRISIILIAITVGVISFSLQLLFISTIEMQLTHQMNSWWEWWKDIHLNSLYFNFHTFLLGICISMLLAVGLTSLKKTNNYIQ